jgi:hypothetical protein
MAKVGWQITRWRETIKKRKRRRFVITKSILMAILVGGVVLPVVSSCATVPTRPLASGEVRLLSVDFRGGESIKAYISFMANIFFEAGGKPEIKKACFYWSGDGPHCFDAMYVTFGPQRTFQVQLPGLSTGSYSVECYAEYIRDGEAQKTNVISTQIFVAAR